MSSNRKNKNTLDAKGKVFGSIDGAGQGAVADGYGCMNETDILAAAQRILDARIRRGEMMTSPRETGDFLRMKLHGRVAEVFCVLWLDNRHRVLAFEELFQGTVDGASVYAREVVRAAIKWNAAACVFSHNHPSGMAEPSAADRAITQDLVKALALIGTRVLDHVVIGDGEPVFMAARGLM